MSDDAVDLNAIEVLHPNLHHRFSGVTSTILAVAPYMARHAKTAIVGSGAAEGVPVIPLRAMLRLGRSAPPGRPFRIWHARRNDEMIVGLILRHALNAKLRLVFTSDAQRTPTRFTRFLVGRMDAVLAGSPAAASFVKRPAAVVLHGVDTGRYRPAEDRAKAWAETGLPGRYGIGVFGRVRPQKGTDLFVEAMLRLLPTHPDFTAVIIGLVTRDQHAFVENLKRKTAVAGLADRIGFFGELPADELPLWFRRVTIFVGPQRNEGFGLTTLEAMASGCAVVATRTGAAPLLLEEGRTGLLVPIEDLDALTARVGALMAEPARAAALGEAARAHVVARHGIEHEAAGIFAIYQRLWAAAGGPA
jgi:mannosyltransferase